VADAAYELAKGGINDYYAQNKPQQISTKVVGVPEKTSVIGGGFNASCDWCAHPVMAQS